jgi:hypothetical protein
MFLHKLTSCESWQPVHSAFLVLLITGDLLLSGGKRIRRAVAQLKARRRSQNAQQPHPQPQQTMLPQNATATARASGGVLPLITITPVVGTNGEDIEPGTAAASHVAGLLGAGRHRSGADNHALIHAAV